MAMQSDDLVLAGFAESQADRSAHEQKVFQEKGSYDAEDKVDSETYSAQDVQLHHDSPTEEEKATLRRVPDKIDYRAYLIAFVELCERFSYYGTTVVFTNFIQRESAAQRPVRALSPLRRFASSKRRNARIVETDALDTTEPLPPYSTTGWSRAEDTSGALGRGQQASTGLVLFNSFWAYFTPIGGAVIADMYLGRFKTIQWSILIALVGHVLLVISSIPAMLQKPNGALALFAVAIVIMGLGTGGFKSNISPLVAEQTKNTYLRVEQRGNERVLVDPALTSSRVFMYFYLMINIGALVGQISMVYAEKHVGFWLSFLLPTCIFLCKSGGPAFSERVLTSSPVQSAPSSCGTAATATSALLPLAAFFPPRSASPSSQVAASGSTLRRLARTASGTVPSPPTCLRESDLTG